MAFKFIRNITISAVISLLTSCTLSKSTGPDAGTNSIGSPLKSYMPRFMKGSENSQYMLAYDGKVNRIHQFDLESMSLTQSFPVHKAKEHQILTGSKSDYIIDVSQTQIDLVKADGTTKSKILGFTGKPETTAFLPDENLFVIVDDLFSIGALELTDSGDILGSFIGGSKISDQNFAGAGDIVAGGTLIVGLSDKSLAKIDLKESIAKQSWQFEKTAPLTNTIKWISAIPGNSSLVMIETDKSLLTYDLDKDQIVTEMQLTENEQTQTIFGRFRDLAPHVYAWSTSENLVRVYYSDSQGQILNQTISYNLAVATSQSDNQLANSVLDPDDLTLVFITGSLNADNRFTQQRVLKIRLSDNMALTDKRSDGPAAAGITKNFILFQYDSPLGYVQRLPYNNIDEPLIYKGFNLDFLTP